MFSRVPQKIDERQLAEPVIIVDDHCRIGSAVEIEELLELLLHGFHVFLDLLQGQQVPFLAFSRRVADEARPAPGNSYRTVSHPLHPGKPHDRDKVPHMQAVGGRVESDVSGDHFFVE